VIGDAQALGTITNDDVSPPQVASLVTWVRPLGVVTTPGSLFKTAGPGWNAGALSRQAILSGDTSVEFSPTTTSEVVGVGLSKGDVNTDISDIDFAIELFLDQYFVIEHGTMMGSGSFGTFAAGDRFAVAVVGGVVTYQRNGVTFHTSSTMPLYRLRVDTALYTAGAALADVVIAGPLVQSAYRAGDFDGDGQADLDIYRPASGGWFNLLSKAGYTSFTAIPFGAAADVPVAGDFDGDTIADIAVYRPSSGVWFVLTSSSYFTNVAFYNWGGAGDVPVPADYDGDGTTDIAIFRPSSGTWFRLFVRARTSRPPDHRGGAAAMSRCPDYATATARSGSRGVPAVDGDRFILQVITNYTTFR
jgi:hypothetical protein